MHEQLLKLKHVLFQFLRFATVGTLGVTIDFGLLNLLSWATGVTRGEGLIPLNVISFGTALTVSFFLNKRWTFKDLSLTENLRKFNLFLIISVLGATINTAIMTILTTHVDPNITLAPFLLLNLAKTAATTASGLWNFFGYKIVVFKK